MSHIKALIAARPHDWLEHLAEVYKIKISRHGDLVSLKYDQIESPMREPIVQECRGMVVDVSTGNVLAWPYNKFWNHGEGQAAAIDWASARVLEKLDGSLMILYFDPRADGNGWRVASSGHPVAGGSYGQGNTEVFADAFWRVARDTGMEILVASPHLTYMFELCDMPNRIVVRHERPRLVLHGARYTGSGAELEHDTLASHARAMGVEFVRSFPISSADGCLRAAAELDPLAQEGFVVVDRHFNRVKVKSPRYVALHLLRGEMTERRAIELWQSGECSELLNAFPEFGAEVGAVHARIEAIAESAARTFVEHASLPTRKEFAAAINSLPYAPVLFRMLQDGGDIEAARSIMRRLSLAALERMLVR